MKNNNIILAPCTSAIEPLYDAWLLNHSGSLDVFFDFITTPTPERDSFILQCKVERYVDSGVLVSNFLFSNNEGSQQR